MIIKKIPNGTWKQNCYVVTNDFNETIIIDPGSEDESIINYCETRDEKNLLAILNTHGHYDHIGGISYLKNKYQIPLYMDSRDETLMRSANLYMKLFEGSSIVKIPDIDFYIDDMEEMLIIGNFRVQFIFSPGHTEGGVSFLIDNALFSGDTILKGKIGRVDLPGGDINKLKKSISRIIKLPENIIIYPGHGTHTSIGSESININEFMSS